MPAGTMRVLCVDDDRVNALLFAETCRLAGGIEVETANDGAEAIDIVDGGFAPDLLVIDLHLPDGSGYALLARLRERVSRVVPAMLYTADPASLVEAPARAAGFDGVWVKPVMLDALLAELKRLRAGARADTQRA